MSESGVAVVSGRIGQLQNNKVDMPEVKEGLEAGIRLMPLPRFPRSQSWRYVGYIRRRKDDL